MPTNNTGKSGSSGHILSSLSIVIPAYNEAGNIEVVVADVLDILPSMTRLHEVIIVDDGSTDATVSVVEGLAAAHPNITCIRHDGNRGMGAALNTGFRQARMEWILYVDADNQIRIAELAGFLPFTERFDMIIGRRLSRHDTLARRVLSRGYNRLIAGVLKLPSTDINCPFKLFRRTVLDGVELRARGFLAGAELLYNALSRNVPVKELPVATHPRLKGKSTVKPYHILEALKELAQMMRAHNRCRRT